MASRPWNSFAWALLSRHLPDRLAPTGVSEGMRTEGGIITINLWLHVVYPFVVKRVVRSAPFRDPKSGSHPPVVATDRPSLVTNVKG